MARTAQPRAASKKVGRRASTGAGEPMHAGTGAGQPMHAGSWRHERHGATNTATGAHVSGGLRTDFRG